MAQQYKFSSHEGKHPSYYNRPTSSFQLQAKVTPFNNGIGLKAAPSQAIDPQYSEDPRYGNTDATYSNDSNPQSKPRHINAKARESQLAEVITHSAVPESAYIDSQAVDQAAAERAMRALSVIGGQSAVKETYQKPDPQNIYFDQKKKMGSKKIVGAQNPDEMISPITGKLVANYGDWRDNVAQTKAYEAAATSTAGKGQSSNDDSDSHPLIERVRAILASRGANGVLGMARLFRIMDDDDSKSLSLPEFKKAMRESGLSLQDTELIALFKLFDTDEGGTISYEEFIHILRRPMNKRRQALVRLAFNIIDKDGSGTLEVGDVCDVYDVTKHPDFISKKKTKDQILKEFLDGFVIGGLKDDGLISRLQFDDYYSNIGASIDNDDYFELMIRNAWHIIGGEGAAANSSNKRVLVTRADGSQYVEEIRNDLGLRAGDKQGMMARLAAQGVNAANVGGFGSAGDAAKGFGKPPLKTSTITFNGQTLQPQSNKKGQGTTLNSFQSSRDESSSNEYALMLLEALKEQLFSRGAKGLIGLQRQFKIMDDDGSNSLDMAEFKKAMQETNVRMKKGSDAEILFKLFDRDNSGTISLEEFLTTIRGALNPMRKKLVNMAFDVLDKDGSGMIDPADLIGVYDTTHHPDVISRKKTSQQVLREFLDGFDVGGVVDGMVTREEFENYYGNISASIDDDRYFELMIRNAWHISGGEGAAANSSNKRVLVTRADGSQYVEEIRNDLGLRAGDKQGMMARLAAQGVNAANVSSYGNIDTKVTKASSKADAASIVDRLRNQATANRTNRTPAYNEPPASPAPLSAMQIALAGPQGGDNNPPPGAPPAFTASKKMFIDTKNGLTAPGGLTDPQNLPSAGLGLLIDRLKATLKSRGAEGFTSLQRMFQNMDEDGNQSLSFVELKNTLKKLNLPVIESDVRKLFEYFDRDKSGTIDFDEFLDGMRGPLSSSRLALIDMAFTELDTDGCDEVPFEAIASHYNAARHPEVIAGRMTAKISLANFLETFDGGVEKEGIVTRDEFINYYSNVGASIDSDEYFDILLRSVWDLGSARNLSAGGEMGSPVRPKGAVRRALIEPSVRGTGLVGVSAVNPYTNRPGSAPAVKISLRGIGPFPGTNTLSGLPTQTQQQQLGQGVSKSILRPMSASATGRPPNATSFPPANDIASKAMPYYSYSYGTSKPLSNSAAAAAKVLGTRLNPAEKIPDNGLLLLINRIKTDLISRGPIGFTGLQRVFQTADVNGDGTLSLVEFKIALQTMNLSVKDAEVRLLFHFFDADESSSISYEEFVKGLRDELNEIRMNVVLKAYKKLDLERNEKVEIGYLASQYNASQHPDVVCGRITLKQALAMFLDTFDAGGEIEGYVTKTEFINYYTNMSAIIDNDDSFESLLRGVWDLSEPKLKKPYVLAYSAKATVNVQPASLRTALSDSQGYLSMNALKGSRGAGGGGEGNPYGLTTLSESTEPSAQLQNEPKIKQDVKDLQIQAVQKFSVRNYSKAIEIFSECLNLLYQIYPDIHPECVKIVKSIEACQKKQVAAGMGKTNYNVMR